MAYHKSSRQLNLHIERLLVTYHELNNRVSIHGVRIELVEEQARRMGAELPKIPLPPYCSSEQYVERMTHALRGLEREWH